ncbi:MAG: N-acetylglucosamine-6-phosphate deacetylase [Rhodobacterales bacterium RIFCSPHIGHO2_02_FULL_62_130]|nr:MAG: N-acetylglucosamine-6-phosphate deacetylase [Rhodobacterales bacterium RIFCSPHIGHO2_02_FULL_62_130]OHC56714.1 MAG: N-acetylglucosamine-6-phosphate deacetylase [Rhodobacterales bacterium RIFCSPHIGHO2_12_FULL_62_75]HCZ00783.1 N-acetylglucosamine-6-phosphate deacetylase [Rhodobacter sp.]
MSLHWLCPDQVFDGQTLRSGMALGLVDGRVQGLCGIADLPDGARRHIVGGIVTPGYLDLQVNGGGDALLNSDPSPAAMQIIAAAHRRFGTVGVLPTVITDRPEVLAAAVEAAIAAKGMQGILGLHIEGPHISLARRGTHAAAHLRPLDSTTMAHVARLRAAGITVKITLAPEAVQPGQIAALVALGAIVSLGHSDATAEAVQAALTEGASCFTHLFNAMSPMLGRAPGMTGAAINSGAYCGFICDGHHVSDAMLGLAIRARPLPDRMFLVSDAMATVGGSDSFVLYGQKIRLVDGMLVNAEGSLAGAHVTMAESVARLVRVLGIAPQAALRMAVTVPATLISAPELAQIVDRDAADLLVLGPDMMPSGTCADQLSRTF